MPAKYRTAPHRSVKSIPNLRNRIRVMPKGMTTLHKNHVMTDQMDSAKCHDRENAVSQCNFYAACRAQRGCGRRINHAAAQGGA